MRQATTEQKRQPALLRTLSHWLIPSVSSDFTGTITAGNRHYRGTTTTQHCTTVLYCTVLYCTVCTVLLYCTALHLLARRRAGLVHVAPVKIPDEKRASTDDARLLPVRGGRCRCRRRPRPIRGGVGVNVVPSNDVVLVGGHEAVIRVLEHVPAKQVNSQVRQIDKTRQLRQIP